VDTIIGTYLPEKSVSFLYYADRLNQLPLGVLGTAVGTALLPLLARQASAGHTAEARSTLNRAIEYALILTLPAAAALAIIADPIMQVLFVGGQFSALDATMSAQSLAAYAAGLPAFVVVKVLAPGFFARGEMATPVKIGAGVLVINVGLNLVLMGPLKHVGPPLATTIAACTNVALLAGFLHARGYLAPDRQLFSRLGRMGLAAGLMAAVLWRARDWLVPHPSVHVPVLALAALIGTGLSVYGLAAVALGLADARALLARFRARALAHRG
jgi:putative peptidoglycan lipid II flippase